MKILLKLFFLFLWSASMVYCQDENIISQKNKIEWFPTKLNIQPFTANQLEAKSGFNFFTNKSNLQLNVGSSFEFVNLIYMKKEFSFGADIFTFTRLRSTNEFKFPVETIDYLFGINFGYKNQSQVIERGFRIRLSHISTHLVDGSYDTTNDLKWRNNRVPIVYSREFIEVIPYVKYENFRIYAGFTYLFHTIPLNMDKNIYQAGFDYFYNSGILPFAPFLAYDLKMEKRYLKYTGNNNFSAGVKFGDYSAKGLSIFYSYISGYSIHGQLFDLKERYSSIGINLDI